MARQMFITVGTSLYESASWEPTEAVRKVCDEYVEWTRPPYVYRPDERRYGGSKSERIRALLRTLLPERGTDFWTDQLPPDFLSGDPERGSAMRYSAEIATLIALANHQESTLAELLARYDHIFVAFDPRLPLSRTDSTGPSRPPRSSSAVAGEHLVAYLHRLAAHARPLRRAGLGSANRRELFSPGEGLRQLVKDIDQAHQEAEVDVVITGGFKIIGIVLGQLIFSRARRDRPDTLRLFYIHEDGDHGELIRVGRDQIYVGAEAEPNPAWELCPEPVL